MNNLRELYNNIKSYAYSMTIDHAQYLNDHFDINQEKIEEEVNYRLSSEIVNSIKDKIVVTKKQRIHPSQYQSQNPQFTAIEYSTEFLVCTKSDFYEIIRDFNRLSIDEQIKFEKFLSPSEEVYINQRRSDVLDSIFPPLK
jgi:hypothetical protein